MSTLRSWLGDGGLPVETELANRRAGICRSCPENRSPRWWEKHSNYIASWIRLALALKNGLGYVVDREDNLHMCRKCGCALPLKVHVPIEHIRKHVSDENLKQYPAFCWQRIESNL